MKRRIVLTFDVECDAAETLDAIAWELSTCGPDMFGEYSLGIGRKMTAEMIEAREVEG